MFSDLLLGLTFVASALIASVRLQDINPRELFGVIRKDFILNASSFQTLYTDSLLQCAMMCVKVPLCFYLNYQISVTKSALCQLFARQYQLDGLLVKKPGFISVQMSLKLQTLVTRSCLEYLRMGVRRNGVYEVVDENQQIYNVLCDFTSEPSSAWTLVLSKLSSSIRSNGKPFYINKPVNQANPNWEAHRLPLHKMEALRSVSTHWRITCNFPVDGVDYRDYVRAKFEDIDIISIYGSGLCKKIQYIDIRGYNYTNYMVPWWQNNVHFFHTDGYYWHSQCTGSQNVPNSLRSEDSFGYYVNPNKKFRCVEGSMSTTNYWFGGYL